MIESERSRSQLGEAARREQALRDELSAAQRARMAAEQDRDGNAARVRDAESALKQANDRRVSVWLGVFCSSKGASYLGDCVTTKPTWPL
jgi:hypothetical protein